MTSFFNIAAKLFIDTFLDRVSEAATTGVRDAADQILERANEHAPFDQGFLIDSSFVDSDGTIAHVGYDVPHAVPLHEHPEYNFQGTGEGKWLQRALDEEHAEVIGTMATGVRKAF